MPPRVAINDPRHDLNAVPLGLGGQVWMYAENPSNVQEMLVETPVNAPSDQICGRIIYTDFHVANAMNGALTFPAECLATGLTPQEKMLEFSLLHLETCTRWVMSPSTAALSPTTPLPPPPPPPQTPPCN